MTVDVWLARTDEWDGPTARALLDAGERRRADRFVRPADRHRYTVAHAALRLVLAPVVDTPPDALAFAARPCVHCAEPHGKPVLAGPPGPEFNLSHSGLVVAVAVRAAGPVGIDVQELVPVDHAAMARHNFTTAERAELAARSEPEVTRRFHVLWARKEAALKATGEGIAVGLRRVDVAGAGPTVAVARRAAHHGATVVVRDVETLPGYTAAVAAPGGLGTITHRRLAPPPRR